MPDGGNGTMAILKEIQELIKSDNREISQEVKDRLILKTMEAVLTRLMTVENNQKKIKESSIGLWFVEHPKMGTVVITVVFILFNLWFVEDFRVIMLAYLGFSPTLLPPP